MSDSVIWPLAAVFCGTFGVVLVAARWLLRDRRIDQRVQSFSELRAVNHSEGTTTAGDNASTHGLRASEPIRDRLRQRLAAAGFADHNAVAVLVAAQAASAVMLAALTGLLMSQLASSAIACTAMATAGAILGYLLPVFWLHRRKMQRLVALRRSLPDLLDLVVSCLDAGVTVEAVLNRIAGEEFFSKSPLGVELRTMQSEIELGATVDRAFLNFADRTDSDDVRSISTVCFQARKYGASICSALRTHADSLRDERETAAEEGIQKAAVKILAPTLLCLFPVILVVLAGPAAIQVHEKLTNSSGQTSHDR